MKRTDSLWVQAKENVYRGCRSVHTVRESFLLEIPEAPGSFWIMDGTGKRRTRRGRWSMLEAVLYCTDPIAWRKLGKLEQMR